MSMTYGSGRFCGSFCAHSYFPRWNKGKKTGPSPIRVEAWKKRKLSPEYIAGRAKRAQVMKDMITRLHRDPIRMAARKAKTQATWAAKKIDQIMGWKASDESIS